MDSLLPSDPSNIDGYVIEGRLGSGGFGIVYAATGPDGRPVAVKVLRPELSDDPRLRERLAREADALSRVEGERTAEIFEVVTEGDLVYLVMERVEGESLTDQVNDGGALSGPMLWFVATGLVQALQEIHAAGIVHRDLKPSNVMYGPDGVKVLDFGISVVADETALTQTGAFVGTGAWMAPEMVLGNDITEKTDVYALGLVLAFIALGKHPFGEGRADALMYRILNTDPDLDGIPAPFIDAVSMCLQRDPNDRPTLDELADFFGSNGKQQISATSIVGSDTGGTRIVQPAATATSTGGNRKRKVLIGTGVAVVLAVIGIIVGVAGGGGSGDDPPGLADGEDTELQSDDVAFVQDDEDPDEQETVEEEATEEVIEKEATEEAIEEEATEEAVEEEATEEAVEEEVTEEAVEEENLAEQEAALEAILTDTYSWGTGTATKTILLQEALGLTADGSYGAGTRQAHLNALEERGLSVANVPEQPTTFNFVECDGTSSSHRIIDLFDPYEDTTYIGPNPSSNISHYVYYEFSCVVDTELTEVDLNNFSISTDGAPYFLVNGSATDRVFNLPAGSACPYASDHAPISLDALGTEVSFFGCSFRVDTALCPGDAIDVAFKPVISYQQSSGGPRVEYRFNNSDLANMGWVFQDVLPGGGDVACWDGSEYDDYFTGCEVLITGFENNNYTDGQTNTWSFDFRVRFPFADALVERVPFEWVTTGFGDGPYVNYVISPGGSMQGEQILTLNMVSSSWSGGEEFVGTAQGQFDSVAVSGDAVQVGVSGGDFQYEWGNGNISNGNCVSGDIVYMIP